MAPTHAIAGPDAHDHGIMQLAPELTIDGPQQDGYSRAEPRHVLEHRVYGCPRPRPHVVARQREYSVVCPRSASMNTVGLTAASTGGSPSSSTSPTGQHGYSTLFPAAQPRCSRSG